jgi:murein DD-endopeptidase MepM/ murein hydrolase activator NlpD
VRAGAESLAALVLLGACATQSGTTWEEDQADGLGPAAARTQDEAAIATPMKAVTIRPKAEVDSTDYADVSRQLELQILRFISQRKVLAQELPRAPAWPKPMLDLWSNMFTELERGYATPAGSLERRILIQTRVSLEVELDLTQRRFGPAPVELADRANKIFVQVALHLRAKPREDTRPQKQYAIRLDWPLAPLIVTSPFGYRRDPILGHEEIRFHSGVDLGGQNGDVVFAAAEGRVTYAGWLGGHGRTVVVQHAGGYVTMYAHLRRVTVPHGAHVKPGTTIGFLGSSGRSTGPHLHFEVRLGGTPIDPLDIVGAVLATTR